MKFSIITATKNAENHIESTIKSVLYQNNVDLEHIIIDSLSKDNTINIIDKYSSDQRIKYISEKDNGISDAFNKGINLSSGDWLIFLGAGDTFINPNILSFASNKLKKLNDYYIVWGNTLLIDNNFKMFKRVNGDISKFKLKRYMCLPHQSTFHKKTFFEVFGLYNNDYKTSMDYDLLLKAFNIIDMNGYIDFDVSFVLRGGVSEEGLSSLKEFRDLQKKHKIWRPVFIADILFFWAIFKRGLRQIFFKLYRNE